MFRLSVRRTRDEARRNWSDAPGGVWLTGRVLERVEMTAQPKPRQGGGKKKKKSTVKNNHQPTQAGNSKEEGREPSWLEQRDRAETGEG